MKRSLLKACQIEKQSAGARALLNHPDLVGMGYGPKERNQGLTDDAAIKLYVRKKEKDLKKLGKRVLPRKLGKVQTDVVEIAPLQAFSKNSHRWRPVLGGTSGAVYVEGRTFTGTLGMAVQGWGRTRGRFFILSNNHVLAHINEAEIGAPILQPGTFDGGDLEKDVIGSLYQYVPLQLGDPQKNWAEQPRNRVDAALAEVNFWNVSREIFGLGYPKGWRTKEKVQQAVIGAGGRMRVQKIGAATAYTTGYVSDLSYDGWVDYGNGRLAFFENQLLISPGSFSGVGDSGAIVFDMDQRIISLLYGGSETHTVANHIEDVRQQLPFFEFFEPRV
ncbi:MAG: hypothetical protein ACE5IR_10525 [bacterium]